MNENYPGYIGYDELQTGVHCCDIAMHVDTIRNNCSLNSALEFLKQPYPKTRPFFQGIENEGDAVLFAQDTLTTFIKDTRRQLCDFAITEIKNTATGNRSAEFCELLSNEVKTLLLSLDFTRDMLSTEGLQQQYDNGLKLFETGDDSLLNNFYKEPQVCIDYINNYYLVGNNTNDAANVHPQMFIVPTHDSTGMLNIAAIKLQRKIIVESARNGKAFATMDYSNGTQQPIYIGYDGRMHFVELQPYDQNKLENSIDNETEKTRLSIYYGLLYLKKNPTIENFEQINMAVNNLKVDYAEVITADKSVVTLVCNASDKGKSLSQCEESSRVVQNKNEILIKKSKELLQLCGYNQPEPVLSSDVLEPQKPQASFDSNNDKNGPLLFAIIVSFFNKVFEYITNIIKLFTNIGSSEVVENDIVSNNTIDKERSGSFNNDIIESNPFLLFSKKTIYKPRTEIYEEFTPAEEPDNRRKKPSF